MVNTNAPFGFRQFGQREGSAPTAGMERFFINSSDTDLFFTGDVVHASTTAIGMLANTGSTGAITDVPIGIVQGVEYYSAAVGRVVWNSYFPASVGSSSPVNVYVCTNPEQLYIVQGTSGAVLGSSNIGQGIPCSITGASLGNQLSGQSVMTVTSSLVTGLSSNAAFRIVDLYSNYAPPGVNGTSTTAEGWQIVVVQPNNFQRNAGPSPVGYST